MSVTNHSRLLQHCVAILDSFDPDTVGVDQHIQGYFQKQKDLQHTDQTFVTEVFSGCFRHTKVMKVVVDGFYIQDGKNCLKADKNLYTVLCYLALHRLDELGIANFRKFVRSQDVAKMHKFLAFFLDELNLKSWMKDEWSQIYEHSYVQVQLLSPILRWLPELQELVSQLEDKLANKEQPKQKSKTPTKVKEFNLTQPKPKEVPIPDEIPKVPRPKTVPKSTYLKPQDDRLVVEARERNRRRAEEQLLEATKYQFGCANAEKSEKTKKRVEEIKANEESKLQFNKSKARKAPSVTADHIPIKLNAATILREGALYQKREDEQIKQLESLEAGAKDAAEFLEWQQSMRQQDLEAELAEIERRRLEGKLSHEDAILARQNLIKENKQKVSQMKEEAEVMMQEYVARRLKEEEVLKQVVEDIMSGHENAKQARVRMQNYKKKIVAEVSEESRELLKQAFEEAEADMKRKVELIQQIRAMEALPKDRTKLVDWTATAGHSLLSEMSIAELKERLSLMKIAQEEEVENKRDEILENKEAKDRLLMEKIQQISRHRAAEGQVAQNRNEQKKLKQQKPVLKDPKLQDLQAQLEKKKQDRLKASKEMKISPNRQPSARTKNLNKQKESLEESRWRELERRKEKQASLQSKGIVTNVAGQKLSSFSSVRKLSAGPVLT